MKNLLIIFSILLPLIAIPVFSFSQTNETTLKTVFIERFTRFVEWPAETFDDKEDSADFFALGIYGNSPLLPEIRDLYSRQTIKGKKVKILEFNHPNKITDCHALFISKCDDATLKKILIHLDNKPILTISDTDGFAQKGVHINMFKENNMIRFEINADAVQNDGLEVSYMLLKLAKIVKLKEKCRL